MELRFVDADNRDFRMLTERLDAYYLEALGQVQLRYAAVNHPKNFACRGVVYEGEAPIVCGCWKAVDDETAEIKRIYVLPEYRRRGAARLVIRAMEADITAGGRRRVVLEKARTTGGSAALYLALGYRETGYYDSPAGAENCRCFEKDL